MLKKAVSGRWCIDIYLDIGYLHDGRADNAAYRHDCRADQQRYPLHDRKIDIQMLTRYIFR